ncbi:hypothetical protein [Pinirhizobacter sp.]|uniref:hypothetical protein n=1 Tax=Pinirhizobacter sp. TaxID=2950432 RepID=UPI002F3E2C38
MTRRHVFSTANIDEAAQAMNRARQAGIANENISLIAREDIERQELPDERNEGASDFYPAALRGVGMGAGSGLLAGLICLVIPPLGITVAGAAAMTVAGAAVGAWTSALAGSAVPDPISRKFEDEIKSGRILVVIDGDDDALATAAAAIEAGGAKQLPFDAPTALT